MKIKTKVWLLAMLFLISLVPASAMTFGEARVNTAFVVSSLPQDAVVQFVLNGGVPVFAAVNASGTARYLPLLEGNLDIVVMLNDTVTERKNITVLSAPTATPTSGGTGSSGSSGSSGGGGIISGEPFANIAKSETTGGSLTAGKPRAFIFKSPELTIYQILITGKENETDVSVKVESLKNTSRLVSRAAPGTVYINENVWFNSKKISKVILNFRVKNAWITSRSVQKKTIKLLRWSDNDWKALDTTVLNSDDTYTYFESPSVGLSSFAISAVKEGQVPVETTRPSTTAITPISSNTSTPKTTPKKPTPGFGMLVTVLVVSAIYMLRRRDG